MKTRELILIPLMAGFRDFNGRSSASPKLLVDFMGRIFFAPWITLMRDSLGV